MEEKIKKEKGEDADLVYTGYNKANLLAEADKGKEKDKEGGTKKDSTAAKKTDSNQYGLWFIIALVVVVPGFIAFLKFNKRKEN